MIVLTQEMVSFWNRYDFTKNGQLHLSEATADFYSLLC